MEKKSITERIKTVEDAYNETGRPKVDFSVFPADLQDFFKSVYDVVVINESLNEGERINLYDSSKARHYPFFNNGGSPSGFRFCDSDGVSSGSNAGSGSRLSLLSEEAADYAGTQFKDEYKKMLEL